MRRLKFTPQMRPAPRSKRSVLNGIRISADQPSASRLRRHRPHGVPAGVDVAPFVGDLRVGLRADRRWWRTRSRCGDRRTCRACTSKRVLLAGREVLADVVDDQRRRRRVVAADDADVERVAIEGEAHRRCARSRAAPSCGSAWTKSVAGVARRHDLLVERAVERDGCPWSTTVTTRSRQVRHRRSLLKPHPTSSTRGSARMRGICRAQ